MRERVRRARNDDGLLIRPTLPEAQDFNVRPPVLAIPRTNERHGDKAIQAELNQALGEAMRLAMRLPYTLDRMRDAEQGQPGAQSLDSGGPRTVLWCWEHESDHCTEPDSAGEEIPCSGLVTHPMRPDGVGEQAISPDQARADEKLLLRRVRGIIKAIAAAGEPEARYTPRPARAEQRRQAEAENQRWCECCAQVKNPITKQPREEWPHTQTKTTVGGRLAVAMYLCRWCMDFVVRTEGQPDGPRIARPDELERRFSGKKVHLPAVS